VSRLYGRRLMLRPLVASDFTAWAEVRKRNHEWLHVWEPYVQPAPPDPARDRTLFGNRCITRERERLQGVAYGFGIFVDNQFCGEINLNNVVRGAFQSAYIGYWIDEARAGRSYMPEAVVMATKFGFEDLHLHRLEIDIVPRNNNSRRVVEKVRYREEGVAERVLEINGTWEDHVRYGITSEEWAVRAAELSAAWL
jgi:[ribosomal protein S5]-alanine N-acetyltransferase